MSESNKTLTIGLGEIGSSINQIEFGVRGPSNVYGLDAKDSNFEKMKELCLSDSFKVCHICLPMMEDFVEVCEEYIRKVDSKLFIIHSTVAVGTTRELEIRTGKDIVHSFCRGVHPNLVKGIKTFEKPIGSSSPSAIKKCINHYKELKIPYEILSSPEASELAKLLDTTYYGYNIIFAKLAKEMCDKVGVGYDEVYTWANETYNSGYTKLEKKNVIRPILYPPEGKIGGHCVVPNFNLLPDGDLKTWCLEETK
jgi:UDP-N-acetyl-D-mannosaminuronate dehydrogenase